MTKEYNSKGELLEIHNDYYVYVENQLYRMFSKKDEAIKYAKTISRLLTNKNVSVYEEERQIYLTYCEEK